MSRSNYTDEADEVWQINLWRGAVTSAIKGWRGQKLLCEMLAALDAMPVKRLIKDSLEAEGEVCAIGCLGRAKSIDMSKLDPEDYESVAKAFGVAPALAQEVVYMNDEWDTDQTPEQRWQTMREWVEKQILTTPPRKDDL